MKSVMPT